MAHTAVVKLESLSPYSQSAHIQEPKEDKERPAEYEKRTWRHRMHTTDAGHVFIPPTQFKNCLSEAAKYLSMQIPSKGKATYTKHFEAGVLVTEGIALPVTVGTNEKPGTLEYEWYFVPSDGKRGGGKRVEKCFGVIRQWRGEVTFHILDDTITEDVFRKHIEEAGKLIGIGRFRPRNNGFYGRFRVISITWREG
jgi:hypothetical protein